MALQEILRCLDYPGGRETREAIILFARCVSFPIIARAAGEVLSSPDHMDLFLRSCAREGIGWTKESDRLAASQFG